jgi:hypothetical protein
MQLFNMAYRQTNPNRAIIFTGVPGHGTTTTAFIFLYAGPDDHKKYRYRSSTTYRLRHIL